MNKALVYLVCMLGFQILYAQEFDVREFVADPADLAARRFEKRTINDEPAAIIKVITNIRGMQFDSNIGIVDVEHKEDGYWLYVAPRERRIQLMATGYLALDVNLPEPAQSLMVYRLVVTSKETGIRQSDVVRLTFRMNQNNVYIQWGNTAPVLSIDQNAVRYVPRGNHTFRFIRQGFAEQQIELQVEEEQIVDVQLQPGQVQTRLALPGMIIITSDPSGAEVFLNEQRVGVTPYQASQVAGTYNLTLRHPLYHDHFEQFVLEEGASLSLPHVDMTPGYGNWHVRSNPSGAVVFLNGVREGVTPFSGQIASGHYELSVQKDLYHAYNERFSVEDGEDKQMDINLQPAYGTLNITSDPDGATLFINGQEVGTTPYTHSRQASGTYQIRLSKELYSDASDRVTVSDGEVTERFVPLSSNFGTLEIDAGEADIYLDDQKLGSGKHTANLAPGRYLLRASRAGHHDAEREVFVMLGQTHTLELKPEPMEGALSIISEPFDTRGARILVNGVKRSETTPAVITLLVGEYTLTLQKEGYQDVNRQVKVNEGELKELAIPMHSPDALPVLTTGDASRVRAGSAVVSGSITQQGVDAITQRGICWGTRPQPTLDDYHTTEGRGTGSFQSTLDNLQPETLYYARAYAINSAGTAFGNTISFRTSPEKTARVREEKAPGKERNVWFGFKGGVNFAYWDGEDVADDLLMRVGYHYGGFIAGTLTNSISYELGIYYSEKGYETEEDLYGLSYNAEFISRYVDIPLLLRFQMTRTLRLHAGIQYSSLIESTYINAFYWELSSDEIAKEDIAMVFGASWRFRNRIALGMDFDLGLLTVDPTETLDIYNRVLKLYLSYEF